MAGGFFYKKALDAGITVNTVAKGGLGGWPLEAVTRRMSGTGAQGEEEDPSIKIIEELLKRGANPNIIGCPGGRLNLRDEKFQDNVFIIYLYRFNENNYNRMWDLLIKYNGNYKPYASEILAVALSKGYSSVADKVINDADINKYPYMWYLISAHPNGPVQENFPIEIMTKLLNKSVDINKEGRELGSGENDMTNKTLPIAEAIIQRRSLDVLRFMVSKGAKTNLNSCSLNEAIIRKDIKLIKFLVEDCKVDVSEKCYGNSLLYIAGRDFP